VTTDNFNAFIDQLPLLWHLALGILSKPFQLTCREGAMTPAFAAASKEVRSNKARYKGVYLVPIGKIGKPSKSAQDMRLAKELYDTTAEVVGELQI
jgi:hypothetical protein